MSPEEFSKNVSNLIPANRSILPRRRRPTTLHVRSNRRHLSAQYYSFFQTHRTVFGRRQLTAGRSARANIHRNMSRSTSDFEPHSRTDAHEMADVFRRHLYLHGRYRNGM